MAKRCIDRSMSKYLFLFTCMLASILEALPPAVFLHKISIVTLENDVEKPEYLVRFKVDKVLDGTSEVAEVTAPVLRCVEEQESIVSKSVNGNGYTVKALVYRQDSMLRVKTTLLVHEGDVVVYNACDDCALSENN